MKPWLCAVRMIDTAGYLQPTPPASLAIPSFLQLLTIRCIAEHCTGCWEYSREQSTNLCPQRAHILGEGHGLKRGEVCTSPLLHTRAGRGVASRLVYAAYGAVVSLCQWLVWEWVWDIPLADEVDGEVSWQSWGSGKVLPLWQMSNMNTRVFPTRPLLCDRKWCMEQWQSSWGHQGNTKKTTEMPTQSLVITELTLESSSTRLVIMRNTSISFLLKSLLWEFLLASKALLTNIREGYQGTQSMK